jgi:hypothetical protein
VTDAEFAELLEAGRERPNFEYKGLGSWTDLPFRARIVRAILALSNTRDGGQIVVGVEQQQDTYVPTGLTQAQIDTFQEETMQDGAAEYAAPFVLFTREFRQHNGVQFVAIAVQEFNQVPVICKKDYQGILQRGAIYVRSRTRRPESVPVSTESDMRDLIELAVDKGIRRLRERGYVFEGQPQIPELYDREIEDLT